jgi:transketolase
MTNAVNKDFIEAMKKYENYEELIKNEQDKMKEFQNKIKTYKEKQDNLENKILQYITANKLNNYDFELQNHMVKVSESKTTETITRDLVEQKLSEFLKDINLGKKATDYIYENRQIKTRPVLKLLKKKQNKK